MDDEEIVTQPLPETHPELTFLRWRDWREYKVENSYLARDGSGRMIRRTHGWSWREATIVILVAYSWPKVRVHSATTMGLIMALAIYAWFKCTQVLYEIVVALPPHGLQLETHRGFPPHPLTATRRFIPMGSLRDFIINEGLRRWDVRFYLAAMSADSQGRLHLDVAYENILPHFPVLLEVYRGVHDALFNDTERQDEAE